MFSCFVSFDRFLWEIIWFIWHGQFVIILIPITCNLVITILKKKPLFMSYNTECHCMFFFMGGGDGVGWVGVEIKKIQLLSPDSSLQFQFLKQYRSWTIKYSVDHHRIRTYIVQTVFIYRWVKLRDTIVQSTIIYHNEYCHGLMYNPSMCLI